jgi:SEC-C motif-containing protein
MKRNVKSPCPCRLAEAESNKTDYSICCGPFLEQAELPSTAEQLMRSRYTAFVMKNEIYLLKSWHPQTRPEDIDFDDHIKWLGLKIRQCNSGTQTDHEGWVEFTARFKLGGKAERLDELSYFTKEAGQWFYVAAVESMLPPERSTATHSFKH